MKSKKISFLIILTSVLMIFFGIVTKGYNGTRYSKQRYKNPPLEYFDVNIFGIDISYINFLLFFVTTLGIGIYLFVYKNDFSIKKSIKKPMFFHTIKKKYLKWEKKSLSNIEPINISELSKNEVPTLISLTTFFALFFTFYMGINMGFSFWFFIILPYYHLITLTPKSKKEILIKSIGYPFIFLIIFAISESTNAETIYGITLEMPLSYYISKHFLPFLVSVVTMFFTQRKRFDSPPKFNIKNPLFWVSLIALLISIFRFGIDKYNGIL